MNLDEKLTRTIASLINKHGIIIIGYRILKEPRFIGLINNATNIFVIDPVPYKPDELAGLGRKNAIQIAENDGKFENFVESLSNRLAVSEYRNWIKVSTNGGNAPLKVVNQLGVEEVTNKIRTRFEIANINKDGVKNLTNEMLHTIENAFTLERIPGGGGICLIFIKDPTAPGGTEIERLILDDHSLNSIITGWDIEAIEMTKRSEDRGKRSVSQWKRNGHTKNLRDYGAVVLIDSVSFTGNTIDVAYNYLCKHSDREPNRYSVAVLVTPQEIVHKLTKLGLTVYSIKPNYSGSDITFPWGWTTATKPVYGKDNLQDPFIPRDRFSFIPKPWGNELTFSDNARVTVNLLTLERGQRTSLHYHLLREETFIVLDNLLQVSLWDQYLKLEQHQSIRIPSGVPHSLIALSQPCRVLEISEGHLDKEDIVRIIDSYERS
jgi:mannose-6-phosphate isomerase-like protein (cupin superfamily)